MIDTLPKLSPGTRVRMTSAGISRDSGSIDRARTGTVTGYRRSVHDGRLYLEVKRDNTEYSGSYYEDSWERE